MRGTSGPNGGGTLESSIPLCSAMRALETYIDPFRTFLFWSGTEGGT